MQTACAAETAVRAALGWNRIGKTVILGRMQKIFRNRITLLHCGKDGMEAAKNMGGLGNEYRIESLLHLK